MSRKLVYTMTRFPKKNPRVSIVQLEYLEGYKKKFLSRDTKWAFLEVEKCLDTKVPTLSGAINLKDEKDD